MSLLRLDDQDLGFLTIQSIKTRIKHSPTMHHYTDLANTINSHFSSCVSVINLVNDLNFSVMVSSTKRSKLKDTKLVLIDGYLWQSPFFGLERNLRSVRHQHSAVFLTMFLIFGPAISFSQRPIHAHLQTFFEVTHLDWNDSLDSANSNLLATSTYSRTNSDGDVIKHCLSKLFLVRLNVFLAQIGSDQAHTTIYVETNTTRRNNGIRIVDIKCSHVPNCEPIS